MSGPRCIVCGKPIAKSTDTIYFRDAPSHRRADGERDSSYGGGMVDLFVNERPRTKADAQRHVNGTIVSVRRSGEFVYSVGVWDGQSYVNQYFHANECAIKQGYASAQHGRRYTWKSEASPPPSSECMTNRIGGDDE